MSTGETLVDTHRIHDHSDGFGYTAESGTTAGLTAQQSRAFSDSMASLYIALMVRASTAVRQAC
jgi:hypothetical protein